MNILFVGGWVVFNGNARPRSTICDRIIASAITRIPCVARFNRRSWSTSIYHSSNSRRSNAKFAKSAYMFQSYRSATIWNTTAPVWQTNASRRGNMRFCCRVVCNQIWTFWSNKNIRYVFFVYIVQRTVA